MVQYSDSKTLHMLVEHALDVIWCINRRDQIAVGFQSAIIRYKTVINTLACNFRLRQWTDNNETYIIWTDGPTLLLLVSSLMQTHVRARAVERNLSRRYRVSRPSREGRWASFINHLECALWVEDSVIAGCWVSRGPLHNRLDLNKERLRPLHGQQQD